MLCVGLDPDLAKLPSGIEKSPRGVLEFCRAIVDATADLVCAFKPQIAYFAAIGAERELEELCSHIRANHPEVVLILDANPPESLRTKVQQAVDYCPTGAISIVE